MAYWYCILSNESAAVAKSLPILAIKTIPPQLFSTGNAVRTFLYTVLLPCGSVKMRESGIIEGVEEGITENRNVRTVLDESAFRKSASPLVYQVPLVLCGNSVNALSQNPQLIQVNSKVSALNQKLFHGSTPIFQQTSSRCQLAISDAS